MEKIKLFRILFFVVFFSILFLEVDAQLRLSENRPYTKSYLPEEEAAELKNYDVENISKTGLYAMLSDANYTAIRKISRNLMDNYSSKIISDEVISLLNHPTILVKRNAIYIIGSFCQKGKKSKHAKPFLNKHKEKVIKALVKIVSETDDSNLLDDALWLLERYFDVPVALAPKLPHLIQDTAQHKDFRRRTLVRWVKVKKRAVHSLNKLDIDFMMSLLDTAFNDRLSSTAAYAFSSLKKDEKIPDAFKSEIIMGLENAYEISDMNRLKIWSAYSLDIFNDTTTQYYDSLENKFETEFMSNTFQKEWITIVSGLKYEELNKFADQMLKAHKTFIDFMGDKFSAPVPGDENDSIILRVFPTMTSYQTQMEAWGHSYAAYAGGLYMEDERTLYTYQRTKEESTLTVEELIAHEFGHYLTGRYIFKDVYQDDDYDSEATVWADEGMAEFIAGMLYDENGKYMLIPREKKYEKYYCEEKEEISFILSDFSYHRVYSYMYFMMTKHKEIMLDILDKYRIGSYERKNYETYLKKYGYTFASLEKEWHATMKKWCEQKENEAREKKKKKMDNQEG